MIYEKRNEQFQFELKRIFRRKIKKNSPFIKGNFISARSSQAPTQFPFINNKISFKSWIRKQMDPKVMQRVLLKGGEKLFYQAINHRDLAQFDDIRNLFHDLNDVNSKLNQTIQENFSVLSDAASSLRYSLNATYLRGTHITPRIWDSVMKLCGMILQLKNAVDYENIEEVLEIEENITIWSLPE